MTDKQLDSLVKSLEYQILKNNLKDINKFKCRFFVYKIKSTMTHNLQVDFLNFLKSKNILLPHEIYNFFLSKQLKFSVKFKPIIRAGLKMNYNMFCEYLRISKQLYEINKKYIFKFYKRNFVDEKKNKEFTQLNFKIINKKQLIFIKYSIDLNISLET